MKKKLFISALLSLVTLCMLFTSSFAAKGAKDTLKDSASKSANSVQSAGDTIKNATMDVTNTAENIFGDGKNMTENLANDVTNTLQSDVTGGYNTIQTSGEQMTNATSDLWLWMILAVIAALIVGVVWYYTARANDTNSRR